MELASGRLYTDSSQTFFRKTLGAKEHKALLEQACDGFNALALPGVVCSVIRLGSGKLFDWSGSRALSVAADIGGEPLRCVLTLNTFGSALVVSCYRSFSDDELFALTHSAESRRRAIIDRLQQINDVDFFLAIDRAVDELMQYLTLAIEALPER